VRRNSYGVLTFLFPDADTLTEMQAGEMKQAHTVESLRQEIGEIVAERQALRARGASPQELEDNRRRLTEAQAELSHRLIERHLPQPQAA
jgi:hypothetical protein